MLNLNLTENPLYTAPASATTAQTPPHAPFICPLSMKEMTGSVPFIALRPCGCVFSDASIRAVIPSLTKGTAGKAVKHEEKSDEGTPVVDDDSKAKSKMVTCPNCGKEFDPTLPTSILPINPSKEVQDVLLENLLLARAATKSGKKRKAAVVDGATAKSETSAEAKAARISSSSPHPRSDSASPAPGSNGRASPAAPIANSLHRSVQQKLAEQEQKRLAAQAGMSEAVKSIFKPKEKGQDYHAGNADFFGRTFTRVSTYSVVLLDRGLLLVRIDVYDAVRGAIDRLQGIGMLSSVLYMYACYQAT